MNSSDAAAYSAVFALSIRDTEMVIHNGINFVKQRQFSLANNNPVSPKALIHLQQQTFRTLSEEAVRPAKALLFDWDFSCGYRKQLGQQLGKLRLT